MVLQDVDSLQREDQQFSRGKDEGHFAGRGVIAGVFLAEQVGEKASTSDECSDSKEQVSPKDLQQFNPLVCSPEALSRVATYPGVIPCACA